MIKRTFVAPTEEEIEARIRMYDEASELGIDLMGFDSEQDVDRSDIRKAVLYIAIGRQVPEAIKKKLIDRKNKEQLV